MLVGSGIRRYLQLLALGAVAMAVAMAFLLWFAIAQKRDISWSAEHRADSVIALTFQMEREFLRLRSALDHAASSTQPEDLETLVLRKDLFLSRIALLVDNPSIDILHEEAAYRSLIPQLQLMGKQADEAFDENGFDGVAKRQALLDRMNALGADVQALSLKAASVVARRLEAQDNSLLSQGTLIIALASVQLVLLAVGAGAVFTWLRRQERENRELQRLNAELAEAKQKAEVASQSKSQFLANMSHELRTPFNGFMGMLSLLESTELSLQQKDYVRTAQASAEHLLTLLNDILDMSALQAGKLQLIRSSVQLDQLMQDALELMAPQAKEKVIGWEVDHPAEPMGWVLADATRLRQIVFNLVSNAIKFTDKGRVRIAFRSENEGDGHIRFCVVVSDTGIGMSPAVQQQLFQRFFRGESGIVRRFGGTGLGLEISQSLAHMMGGEIRVESSEGRGSVFTCSVVLEKTLPPPHAQVAAVTGQGGGALTDTVSRGASGEPSEPAVAVRVLVVEDHPVNRKLAGALLKKMGCEVFFSEDGQQAVNTVAQGSFDAILMDVNMPVMDGLTATRMIRGMEPPHCEIPIIVFTADVSEGWEIRATEAGANDYIAKPVQLTGLRAMLQKYISTPLVG